ncbi:MAG: heme exporter protein CcmB [Alphaproteobacteria bacterium]|nr:heme exporter protein CcmB [Alphaproteobacteria bacterium]
MTLMILLRHDIRNLLRRPVHLYSLIAFVTISMLLFPLALGPDPRILSQVATGLWWVLILFSSHLIAPQIWREDLEDGTWQQLSLTATPPEWIILSKAVSVWLTTFGSLILFMPFLGLTFGLSGQAMLLQAQTFLLISPALSLLTLSAGLMRQNNNQIPALSTVILLPLYVPLLIFSCLACHTNANHSAWNVLIGITLLLSVSLLYLNIFLLRWQR